MLLECKNCEALVYAKEIAAHQYQEEWGGEPLPWESKETLDSCPRCKEPMLAYETDWIEEVNYPGYRVVPEVSRLLKRPR